MLGLASGSKEALLTAIWTATLYITVAALIVLIVLVVRRILMEKRKRARARNKAQITKLLLGAMTLRERLPQEALPAANTIDPAVAVDAALDLLRAIEGEDERYITKVLRCWGLVEFAKERLRHGRRGQRIRALTLLSHFEDPDTLPLIADQTEASDPYVQLAAIRALADRGAVEELPRIIKALTEAQGTNPVMLADVLSRFGPKAGPALMDLALAKEAQLGARVAALRVLNTVGGFAPLKSVKALLDDPSPEIRAKAVMLLPKTDANAVAPCLLKALRDPSTFVRVRAARIAGNMNVVAAAPLLVLALKDSDWWMRYRAAEALAQFGGKGLQILKALAKGDDETAATAAQVVAETRAA